MQSGLSRNWGVMCFAKGFVETTEAQCRRKIRLRSFRCVGGRDGACVEIFFFRRCCVTGTAPATSVSVAKNRRSVSLVVV